MSVRDLKRKSETDWDRVDRMTDDEIDTSDIPPLDDAFFERAQKLLPRIRIDRIDLRKAREFADYILASDWSNKESTAHDAFNIALIVSYSRPFTARLDLEEQRELRLDEQIEIADALNEEERKLHDRVKELRNQTVAHSDARSVLLKGYDYSRDLFLHKAPLKLTRAEVELLRKIIDRWIEFVDERIKLTKAPALLIAPDAES